MKKSKFNTDDIVAIRKRIKGDKVSYALYKGQVHPREIDIERYMDAFGGTREHAIEKLFTAAIRDKMKYYEKGTRNKIDKAIKWFKRSTHTEGISLEDAKHYGFVDGVLKRGNSPIRNADPKDVELSEGRKLEDAKGVYYEYRVKYGNKEYYVKVYQYKPGDSEVNIHELMEWIAI